MNNIHHGEGITCTLCKEPLVPSQHKEPIMQSFIFVKLNNQPSELPVIRNALTPM